MAPDHKDGHDPAAARFWTLQFIRLSGMLTAILGALIIAKVIFLPEPLGPILLVLGAAEFFVLPIVLARKWKSAE